MGLLEGGEPNKSPMTKEHIERFRQLVSFRSKTSKQSLSLRTRVNGKRNIINVCEVTQSGETVAMGEGANACEEALDNFEEILESME